MIDAELVTRKIVLITRDLTALEPIARLGQPGFLADPTNEALAERYLERMIGRMIDINYHLITETGNPPPADYYGSFTELGRVGALDPETAQRLASSAGLRDRIVHEYDELDPKRIFEAVQASLRDIPEYLRQVNAFVSRSST
jgi:uncharacterized protein YutE (UPF0331/DUF86 family)